MIDKDVRDEWDVIFDDIIEEIKYLNSLLVLDHQGINMNPDLDRKRAELVEELWAFFPDECENYTGPVIIT